MTALICKEDFMCSCDPDGLARCQDTLHRVHKDLECSADTFLSAVAANLEWGMPGDFRGEIKSICSDQWFGVGAELTRLGDKVANIWCPCDMVEYGVARAYELLHETCAELEPPMYGSWA